MRRTDSVERAINVQNTIAECDSFEALSGAPLRCMADYVNADAAILVSIGPTPETAEELVLRASVDIEGKQLEDYFTTFQRQDPVIHFALSTARRPRVQKNYSLYRLFDVCENTQFNRTRYYRDFLRTTGIFDILIFQLCSQSATSLPLLIGFHRRDMKKVFSQEEMMRARFIAPVLSACLSRMALAESIRPLETALGAYSRSASPDSTILIFDERLNITQRYGAEVELSEAMLTQLKLACSQLKEGSGANRPTTLCDEAGAVLFTGAIERISSPQSGDRFVAVLHPDDRFPAPRAAAAWKLTPRETDIVERIYSGARNADIAATLSISLKTVENHICNIFSKANVSSRSELISRLATGRL